MALNKVKVGSNMYPFLNDYPFKGANQGYTWNPISGKCLHDCIYCYMKVWPQKELHLNEKALKDNLGRNRFIFVGSSTDMFADNVPAIWIQRTLEYCRKFDNEYLFQTKNPIRFYYQWFPEKTIIAVTLESNRNYSFTKAPDMKSRFHDLLGIESDYPPIMISIEPIMDFDMDEFLMMLRMIEPDKISVGADSQKHNLPEPEPEKLKEFIWELKLFTEDIVIKDNLKRLLI